jgi:hypothetical protein
MESLSFIEEEIKVIEAKYPEIFNENGLKLKDCITFFRHYKTSNSPKGSGFTIGYKEGCSIPDDIRVEFHSLIDQRIF